jgi:hypothetical protein
MFSNVVSKPVRPPDGAAALRRRYAARSSPRSSVDRAAVSLTAKAKHRSRGWQSWSEESRFPPKTRFYCAALPPRCENVALPPRDARRWRGLRRACGENASYGVIERAGGEVRSRTLDERVDPAAVGCLVDKRDPSAATYMSTADVCVRLGRPDCARVGACVAAHLGRCRREASASIEDMLDLRVRMLRLSCLHNVAHPLVCLDEET